MTKTIAEQTETFETRDAAWAFMRECDAKGWCVGYPQIARWPAPPTYSVRYYAAPVADVLAAREVAS